MFDNLTPSQNSQPQNAAPAAPAAPVMPKREPEDIFAATDAPVSGGQKFADKPPQLQPKNQPAGGANVPGSGEQTPPAVGGNRRYFLVGVIAIGALLLILIAMVALAYMKSQEAGNVTDNLTDGADTSVVQTPVDTAPPVVDDTSLPADVMTDDTDSATTGALPTDSATPDAGAGVDDDDNSQFILDEITDSDGDGLTDGEENRLGTDPDKSDTDGDGLFDRQEVRIYRTDPINPDSDGDGYMDGEEVDNGYNPKGEGLLYELP